MQINSDYIVYFLIAANICYSIYNYFRTRHILEKTQSLEFELKDIKQKTALIADELKKVVPEANSDYTKILIDDSIEKLNEIGDH